MKVGDEYKLPNGGNVYSIQEIDGRHVYVMCIWFSEKEDLGDGIMCTREGQKIWVARFFADYWKFIISPVTQT